LDWPPSRRPSSTWTRAHAIAISAGVVLCSWFAHAQRSAAQEWLTWGGDVERTSWNRVESALSKKTVGQLTLKWKAQIDKQVPLEIESGASMLTGPLVAQGIRTPGGTKTIVYTLSAGNTIAALDAATGAVVWQRTIENTVEPGNPANWLCTNTSTATPVIDKESGTIYMIAADGRLYGLDLASGERKLAAEFVPPYSRNWSLNLVDGFLYTTVGRGCGNGPAPGAPSLDAGTQAVPMPAPDPLSTRTAPAAGRGGARVRPPVVASHMIAIDLKNPAHPTTRFFTSPGRPGGAWTRAGLVASFDSLFVQTADGPWDPAKGLWSQSLLRLSPKTLAVQDYFTPPNLEEINAKDLDYASGGTVAFALANRQLVISAGKDGTVYLHDARSLGGPDHRTPLVSIKAGNDEMSYASTGVWGAPATFVNGRHERWVYLPMWGPPSKNVMFARTNGAAPHGSIMAFQVVLDGDKAGLAPKWVSRDLSVPDSPVVANGVVYAISTGENTLQRHTDPRYHEIFQKAGEPPLSRVGTLTAEERGQHTSRAVLYAFDAETGDELFSSKDAIDDWTHLSTITVVDGSVYVTTRQSFVYAFGLKK
jgi:outer membrane protein assembly factor BamB